MRTISSIKSKAILVIGDIMLDTYYTGKVERISPEAPVPVFRKSAERSVPGGAANVAVNLIAADQKVFMMSIVGTDEAGTRLKHILDEDGINTELVFKLNRETTEKIRFLANNHQQVLRLDIENTEEIDSNNCQKMLTELEKKIDQFDLIVLSDYLKGLFTYEFTQGVLRLAARKNIRVIVDVKGLRAEKYKNAYLLKPNLKELRDLTAMPVRNDKEILTASETLREKSACQYVLTTCGARGMVLVGTEDPYFIDSVGQEVFDVTGAGDTTIAYLAACMANAFSMKESVQIANLAASIQISKVGTSAVYWKEVKAELLKQKGMEVYKILTEEAVSTFRKSHSEQKIVFTNGCFDLLHIGHVRYLQEAAKLGDILVVGLNSDASVKRLKGPKRPINKAEDRAEILCALGFVDYVVIFEEDTPLNLIKKIQPDVLVKGEDYKKEYVVGTKEVKERGGQLVLIPLVKGKSSTNIIHKIRK